MVSDLGMVSFVFRACLNGFQKGCRPLLFLDGTHLKDGNESFFHLAFTIVDNETDGNWMWFIYIYFG